ncbi:MAG: O-antigen ligase family protein [Candidatus Rokuibacteriota bacterium]
MSSVLPPASPSPPSRVRDTLLVLLVAGLAASISLSEIVLALLALWLLATRATRGGYRALAWPLAGPIVGFTGWTVVTALASGRTLESLTSAKNLLVLATFWVVLHALPDAPAARRFVARLAWALAAVSVVAILQVGTCSSERLYAYDPSLPPLVRTVFGKCARAHGFFSIYMTLAGVLGAVLLATLPRLESAGRPRWLARLVWLVSATAFGLTFVRGAWLGFAAGVLVMLALLRRRAGAPGVMLLLAAGIFAVPGVVARIETIADPADLTARERLFMIQAGLRLAAEHPLLGIGPGGVKRAYPEYVPREAVKRATGHLHNTPLQIAVERGLVGLGLWLAIFVDFFVRAGRVLRRLPRDAETTRALVVGSVSAVAGFLVAGLFEYNFGDAEVLLVAMIIMALPFVVERDRDAAPARIAPA